MSWTRLTNGKKMRFDLMRRNFILSIVKWRHWRFRWNIFNLCASVRQWKVEFFFPHLPWFFGDQGLLRPCHPEGEYLCSTVMIWDESGYVLQQNENKSTDFSFIYYSEVLLHFYLTASALSSAPVILRVELFFSTSWCKQLLPAENCSSLNLTQRRRAWFHNRKTSPNSP